jgi:hypothetical protein
MDLEGGVVRLRGVEETLERGAGEVGRAEVGEGRCRGAAGLLLQVRRTLLRRGAGRVGVAAGGHGGGRRGARDQISMVWGARVWRRWRLARDNEGRLQDESAG